MVGTDERDVIYGYGGDDDLSGGAGDDEIMGGYGDDRMEGGDGNDVLDGGRGSDLPDRRCGRRLADRAFGCGEQRIGQLAIGGTDTGRPGWRGRCGRQKLSAYLDQPLVGDDILVGGEGRDTFLIAPQLNGKLDIIEQHIRSDGTIRWSGVAGENDEVHDHWTESTGIDIIADYVAGEDHIAIIGHTANVYVTHRDLNGDGVLDTQIDIISQQGDGGGAHTQT